MRRRFLYVILGSVVVNLSLMAVMYVRMQRDEQRCDVSSRGLAIRDDARGRWEAVSPPRQGSDLAPCRARVSQHLVFLPD